MGFSEGFNNQYNSARVGWRWLEGELQLFAYVYVKGTLLKDAVSYDPPFIKSVAIGKEINCSIAISGGAYILQLMELQSLHQEVQLQVNLVATSSTLILVVA